MQYKWKMVALLFCCGALNYGDRAATRTVFPLLQSDFGMTNIGMAAVGSLFLWTYALGSPIAGILADRLSPRVMIAASLATWSPVTLASGFAASATQLLITRALLGFAECLYLPAAIALIADHHDEDTRATAIGIHTAGLSIGLVAGGSAAGYLGAHYGWQAAFRTLGILGLLLSVFAYGYLRDAGKQQQRIAPSFEWTRLKALLVLPTYTIIVSEALGAAIANNIFVNWFPLFFKESYGLSLAAAGFSGTFLLQFSSVAGAAAGGVVRTEQPVAGGHGACWCKLLATSPRRLCWACFSSSPS